MDKFFIRLFVKQTVIISFTAAALLGLAACVKVPTAPVQVETFPLRATVTPDNHCTVDALGKTYTSIGQVRGAVLPNFTGDVQNEGLHAIGCWVSNVDGSDGDLIITNLFIFALAGFLGFEVIRRVPKLLHTPLMALTNALSAIALVGSLFILGQAATTYSIILGFVAVVASTRER